MADELQQRTEVDDQTLARVLRCDVVSIRRYVKSGVLQRGPQRKFALFEAIGNVVEHLRAVAGRQSSADTLKAGAALKDAQRRLTEMKLAKLDGTLMSLTEAEALWGDLAAATKWLFLAIPARARIDLNLSDADCDRLSMLCVSMLREVAFTKPMQLPSGEVSDADADDDDESDATVADKPAAPED